MEEEALFVFPTDDSIQYLGMLLFFSTQGILFLETRIFRLH